MCFHVSRCVCLLYDYLFLCIHMCLCVCVSCMSVCVSICQCVFFSVCSVVLCVFTCVSLSWYPFIRSFIVCVCMCVGVRSALCTVNGYVYYSTYVLSACVLSLQVCLQENIYFSNKSYLSQNSRKTKNNLLFKYRKSFFVVSSLHLSLSLSISLYRPKNICVFLALHAT